MSVKVIFKKEFDAPAADFVRLRQYLVVSDNGERALALRLTNDREEKLTAVTVEVVQVDEEGYEGAKEQTRIPVKPGARKTFVPDTRIPLDGDTVGCKVRVLSAEYGYYTYSQKDGRVQVVYTGPRRESDPVVPVMEGVEVTPRRMRVPFLIIFGTVFALLLSVVGSIFHLIIFKETEYTFLHGGVLYAFENNDKSDGSDIYVIGYHGRRTDIHIPAEIEGHNVTRVADLAFAFNDNVKSVSFGKPMPIGDRAFEYCSDLVKVDFGNITSMGPYAFTGCESLADVEITDALLSIPEGAFSYCTGINTFTVTKSAVRPFIKIEDKAFEFASVKTAVFERDIDYDPADRPAFFRSAQIGHLTVNTLDTTGAMNISDLFGVYEGKDVKLGGLLIVDLETIPADFCSGIPLKQFAVRNIVDPTVGDRAFYGCSELKKFSIGLLPKVVGEQAFCGSGLATFDGSGLERVGSYAFADCSELLTFKLAGNKLLTSLGVYAFAGCEKLTTLTLPASIKGIPEGLFSGCKSLSRIVFPKGSAIESVDTQAFSGCSSLTDFDFPGDALSFLGKFAFEDCVKLKKYTVPDTVRFIGLGVFKGCSALSELTVPFLGEGKSSYGTLSRLFGEGDAPSAAELVPEALKKVTLTSATEVSAYAFYGLTKLEEAVINDGVTSVGENAFYACESMSSLVIPDSVTYIGPGALEGMSGLKEYTAPFAGVSRADAGSYEYISDGGMCELFGETGFPRDLRKVVLTDCEYIATGSFAGMNRLEQLVIDCPVKAIGGNAFDACYKLYEIFDFSGTLSLTAGEENNGGAALSALKIHTDREESALPQTEFEGMRFVSVPGGGSYLIDLETEVEGGLTELTLPSSVPSADGKIEFYALWQYLFPGNAELKTVDLPLSVTAVGRNCFADCVNLEKVLFAANGVARSIGESAFARCFMLYEVRLPANLSTVGEYAFADCQRLKSIVVPSAVFKIEDEAFDGCNRLFEVYDLSDNIEIVKGSSDNGKIALNARVVYRSTSQCLDKKTVGGVEYLRLGDGGIDWWAVDYYGDGELKIEPFDYNGEKVERIGIFSTAFRGYASITEVTVSTAVARITDEFSGCGNIRNFKITGGGANEAIELTDGALNSLGSLESFYASAPVSRIGQECFASDVLSLVEFADRVETVAADPIARSAEGLIVKFDDVGSIYPRAFRSSAVKKFTAADVGTVGTEAFFDCSYLTDVSFASVDSVGERAFTGCQALVKADLGSVGEIGEKAFYSLSALSELKMTGADTIGNSAFAYTAVTELTLSGKTSSIGSKAFYYCELLGSVSLGDVDEIKAEAFRTCGDLTSVSVERMGTSGNYAFADCEKLSSVTVNGCAELGSRAFFNDGMLAEASFRSMSVMGEGAFQNCFMLSDFAVPEGVSVIPNGAFSSCYSLMRVVLPSTLTEIASGAFVGCNNILYVYNKSALSHADIAGSDKIDSPFVVSGVEAETVKNLVTVVVPGGRMYMAGSGDRWCLYDGTTEQYLVTLPRSFRAGGATVENYSIRRAALYSTGSVYVVGTNVTAIGESAFPRGYTVYYEGSESEWAKTVGDQTVNNVLFLRPCIHESTENRWKYWRYDGDMPVNSYTVFDEGDWTVVKQPSCLETGRRELTCSGCKEVFSEPLDRLSHELEQGRCKLCSLCPLTVTAENFSDIAVNGNADAQFAVNSGTNIITSPRVHYSETGTFSLSITADDDIYVEFDFNASLYYGDSFTVAKNGSVSEKYEGDLFGSVVVQLKKGDVLTLSYIKTSTALESFYNNKIDIIGLTLLYKEVKTNAQQPADN